MSDEGLVGDVSELMRSIERGDVYSVAVYTMEHWQCVHNNRDMVELFDVYFWVKQDSMDRGADWCFEHEDRVCAYLVMRRDVTELERLNSACVGSIPLMRDGWTNLGLLVAMTFQFDELVPCLLSRSTMGVYDPFRLMSVCTTIPQFVAVTSRLRPKAELYSHDWYRPLYKHIIKFLT